MKKSVLLVLLSLQVFLLITAFSSADGDSREIGPQPPAAQTGSNCRGRPGSCGALGERGPPSAPPPPSTPPPSTPPPPPPDDQTPASISRSSCSELFITPAMDKGVPLVTGSTGIDPQQPADQEGNVETSGKKQKKPSNRRWRPGFNSVIGGIVRPPSPSPPPPPES